MCIYWKHFSYEGESISSPGKKCLEGFVKAWVETGGQGNTSRPHSLLGAQGSLGGCRGCVWTGARLSTGSEQRSNEV